MSAPVDPPDPAAAAVAAAVAAVPPAVPASPWAADAAAYFGDNAEAIASFDRYMREKQQPYITELEGHPGRELWKDLSNDAEGTLADVIGELYGEERPDIVEQFQALFADPAAAAAAVVEPATTPAADEPPAWAQPLIERDQAQRDADARAAADNDYKQALTEMRAAHPELTDVDMGDGTAEKPGLIHPFMAAASGDTEVAYAGYQAYLAQVKAMLGVAPTEDEKAAAAAAVAAAPPVLGGDGATAAAPPVTKEYKTFDDAWDDWQAERAQVAPPVVGSA